MSESPADLAQDFTAHAAPSGSTRRARRVLFVSSTTTGGSGRSQRELAVELSADDRDVRFLVDAGRPSPMKRRLLEEFTDASVRFDGSPARPAIEAVRRRFGGRSRPLLFDGLRHETTVAPENAFESLVAKWRPDVVVVSSISRVTWRSIRTVCRRRGIPTVLHLREATAIGHLTAGLTPDLLLANSETLVRDVASHSMTAELVPSLVNVAPMERPPTADVALLVNPIATHGIDVVGPLAAALPHIPIVLQESWILSTQQRVEVDRLVDAHENISFRAFDPRPELLFRDARVLLAPHCLDNRPRTVLEAQTNGVPVIATDYRGLVEAVGPGGLVIDRHAGPDAWVRTLGELWDDGDLMMNLGDRARTHAARPEIRPDYVAQLFGELVDQLVSEVH